MDQEETLSLPVSHIWMPVRSYFQETFLGGVKVWQEAWSAALSSETPCFPLLRFTSDETTITADGGKVGWIDHTYYISRYIQQRLKHYMPAIWVRQCPWTRKKSKAVIQFWQGRVFEQFAFHDLIRRVIAKIRNYRNICFIENICLSNVQLDIYKNSRQKKLLKCCQT